MGGAAPGGRGLAGGKEAPAHASGQVGKAMLVRGSWAMGTGVHSILFPTFMFLVLCDEVKKKIKEAQKM